VADLADATAVHPAVLIRGLIERLIEVV